MVCRNFGRGFNSRQPTNHDWTVKGQHQQKQEVRSLSKTPPRRWGDIKGFAKEPRLLVTWKPTDVGFFVDGQNDQFTPATAFHGDSTPALWLYPTPRCPLNVLLNEALIPAWYIPRLPDKSLTKLPSLFTFTRLSSTNSLRTAAFSQGSFPYRSPGACCNSALRPVHDIYCGYRLISIPCHWINDSSA